MTHKFKFPDGCKENCIQIDTHPGTVHFREHGVHVSGISRLVSGYDIKRDKPDFYLVLFTFGGKGRVTVGKRTLDATPGTIMMLPPGAPHHYCTIGDHWNKFWFHLYQYPFWDFLAGKDFFVQKAIYGDLILGAMNQILAESVSERVDYVDLMRAHSETLFIYLCRELGFSAAGSRYAHFYSKFSHLWEEVSARPEYAWDLELLARKLYISVPHFCRLCKQFYNVPPMRMVTRLRLQAAQELLRNTTLTLDAIAGKVGYNNAFSFSAAFKKYFGMPPSRFRNG
jgi:AraC-like DNA-binding protein